MTATADVFTKTNESALSVPIQSVAVRTVDQLAMKGEDRKAAEEKYKADKDGFVEIVFVIEDGKAVARMVKTGIQSEELIEVLEGLNDGEEIVSGSYRAISKDLVNGAAAGISKGLRAQGRAADRRLDGELAHIRESLRIALARSRPTRSGVR
jgi:HlyD family secretion protein